MRKNMMHPGVADEVILRAANLQEVNGPRWGRMQVTEMLYHCNMVHQMILEGKPDDRASTVRQRVVKFLFLHVIPQFPKNVKAPVKIKTMEAYDGRFGQEMARFAEVIRKFTDKDIVIRPRHPVFGKLTNAEWGTVIWMHMDHHLRQFGV